MATLLEHPIRDAERPRLKAVRRREPAYQAYAALYVGFAALPVVAGLDKFAYALVDWDRYLAPQFARTVGWTNVPTFMKTVGVVEVAAGLLVAFDPRLGAPVVGAWLLGIIANLLLTGAYFDVALRDFGLAVGAFALWRLSLQFAGRRNLNGG